MQITKRLPNTPIPSYTILIKTKPVGEPTRKFLTTIKSKIHNIEVDQYTLSSAT